MKLRPERHIIVTDLSSFKCRTKTIEHFFKIIEEMYDKQQIPYTSATCDILLSTVRKVAVDFDCRSKEDLTTLLHDLIDIIADAHYKESVNEGAKYGQ